MTRHLALRLGALLGSAALVSSCALVLGFEDHELYPAGDTTSGSGGGTTSSTVASGGAGGAGGASSSSSSGTGGAVPSEHFGPPEIIASGQAGPSDINYDGTTVFWVNVGLAAGEAQIMRLLKSGGAPEQVAFKQDKLYGLEVTPTSVWTAERNGNSADSFLAAFGKAGSTNFASESYQEVGGYYYTVALQGTVLAWSSAENGGSVFRGDTLGSAKSTLASMQGHVGRIALDGSVTYWVSSQQSAIMRENGGTVDVFAGGQTSPTDVIVDADDVYWTGNDGTVKKLAKTSPGGQPTVIAGDALSPQGIALDATNVYWAEADAAQGRVRTAPKAGGKVETIATGQYPFDVAVDSTAVYVTMQGDGNIVKIPKK